MSSRCHLVYALSPAGVSARDANDLLNEYVADRSRSLAVCPRYWWKRAS